MHVPDGFLNIPTSAATAAAAVPVVGLALHKARQQLDDRLVPMAGLGAAFVFAAQMVNFPVGVGTSGHLLGGALIAALVGPSVGILCLTVVVLIQALLFADGGITALGTNVWLIAIISVAVGWGVQRALLKLLPNRKQAIPVAAAVGGFASLPLAAAAFVLVYLVGGVIDLPAGALFGTMLGWHVVIGLGEGAITGLVLAAVASSRPDLLFAERLLDNSHKLTILEKTDKEPTNR